MLEKITWNLGSPPPMRGKVFLAPLVLSVIRITPAYAGKSVQRSKYFNSIRDHPRLCGEKSRIVIFYSSVIGSPPPMRGKVSIKAKKAVMMRITPAYAGKSRGNCFTDRFEGDHPRLCGEKSA